MIVCDTGPLVAAALSNDSDHKACVDLFTALHAARRELLVPATVIAEVGYLLAREAGARVESLFLQSLADGDFTPVDLTSADFARMADLVNTYESLPLNHRRLGCRDSRTARAARCGDIGPPSLHRGPAEARGRTDPAALKRQPAGDPRSLGRSAE